MVPPCLGECACCWEPGSWHLSFFPPLVVPPHCPSSFYIVSVEDAVGFRTTIGTTILRLIAGLAIGVGVALFWGCCLACVPR